MLEMLGNDLTAQGRQSLANILTVKESYLAAALSAIQQRYGNVDAAGGRVSAHRPGPRRAAGPAAGRLTPVAPNARGAAAEATGKNVISYTSDLPVQRNAHIMRSHLLSQSLTKACVALISHTTLKTMKLSTLLAAAFAIVGFCNTASAVTYPLPTDGSRLVGQNGHHHSG